MTTAQQNGDSTQRYCAFCGLPLSRSFVGSERSAEEIDYCCSGCRAVASVEAAEAERGNAASSLMRLGLAIFFSMNVMVFTLVLWSQDLYPDESFATELSIVVRSVFRWASMVFSLPVVWLLGGPIARGVFQSLRRRAITTDLLILLGVCAAYGYSAVSVLRGSGHVYFEVGCMVLVFVSLGRWLEAKGKRRTNESLDALERLLPTTVRRLNSQGDFEQVNRPDVEVGDLLRVLPGERIPIDGHVTSGTASIDQQVVTGESLPTEKTVGDQVFSGTLNLDGDLRIQVTAADGQETLSRLIDMVRAARRVKGPQELLADRVAAWFVPLVCTIALAAAWYQGNVQGLDHGIMVGLAVVLIACPCALGLATPIAVWTALGRAAKSGVVFRSGMVMQQLAQVDVACFDKTGTLTGGEPSIDALLVAKGDDQRQVAEIAATISRGSVHPLSQAIVRFGKQYSTRNIAYENVVVETIPGKGLRGEVPQRGVVVLGSRRLMQESSLEWPSSLIDELVKHQDAHEVFIGWQGKVRGAFRLAESMRPEVAQAVGMCYDLGLKLHMLTGDVATQAAAIAQRLDISTRSELLPDDKVAAIKRLSSQNNVAMIGDGLNDAPALAAADVGVALGCGADVSRDAAGVCLVGNDLRRFPWAISLARKTSRIVKQNLFWAFSYNGIGIALAATGHLNPIWAALAMAVSSLLVVTNSLRLSHFPEALIVESESSAAAAERVSKYSLTQSSGLAPTHP